MYVLEERDEDGYVCHEMRTTPLLLLTLLNPLFQCLFVPLKILANPEVSISLLVVYMYRTEMSWAEIKISHSL